MRRVYLAGVEGVVRVEQVRAEDEVDESFEGVVGAHVHAESDGDERHARDEADVWPVHLLMGEYFEELEDLDRLGLDVGEGGAPRVVREGSVDVLDDQLEDRRVRFGQQRQQHGEDPWSYPAFVTDQFPPDQSAEHPRHSVA